LAALQENIRTHRLTLITGPAGYGKSALLASYYFQRYNPDSTAQPTVYWLSLDSNDNDPAIFALALIQALQLTEALARREKPNPAGQLDLSLTGTTLWQQVMVGTIVNAMMAQDVQPIILLLDDCHLVEERSVYQLLDTLLTRLPPQMRIVMASRAAPPLALARLSSRGQLAEYTIRQLTFSLGETEALLNGHFQLALAAPDLHAIHSYTEGWATGLRFVATALQRYTTEQERTTFVARLGQEPQALATQSYLYEYLAYEVLDQQAPRLHAFLVQSSILTELTPEACRQVTGNSHAAEFLDELYRHNLFIIREKQVHQAGASQSTTSSYRYQTIFAQFLRNQLTLEQPTVMQELHQRASSLASLSWEARITHALQAQAWPIVTQLLTERGTTRLQEDSPDHLLGWLEQLPATVMAQQPMLLFIAGYYHWLKGNGPAAAHHFAHAFAQFATKKQAAEQGHTLCYWAASLLLSADHYGAAAKLEQASTYPLTADAHRQSQLTQLWLGLHSAPPDWQQTERILSGLLTSMRPGPAIRAGLRDLQLSSSCLLLLLENIRPALLESCQQAAMLEPRPDRWWQLSLDNLQAWSAWLHGAIDQAHASLAQGLARCRQMAPTFPPIQAELVLLQSVLALLRQDYSAAQQSLQAVREQPLAQASWLYCTYTLARSYCEVGHIAAARQLHEELKAASSPIAHPHSQIYSLMLGGLLEMHMGSYVHAEDLLRQAVTLEGHYRSATLLHSPRLLLAYLYLQWKGAKAALSIFLPFFTTCLRQELPGLLYQGGGMTRALLATTLRQHVATAQTMAFLSKLEGEMQIAVPHLPDTGLQLSRRELAVLELLTAGASNRGIAEQLNITLPTVKSHLTRLFTKLNVTSRQAAVTRARELGVR